MKPIVEYGYVNFPPLAARFYDAFMLGKATQEQVRRIAEDLAASASGGRLLDIGTGPGRMLGHLHELRPDMELYGLDISKSMIDIARKNLSHFSPDLRVGTIRKTNYEDDNFDMVTCTGSMYVWQEPVSCLNEIERILKPGGRAILIETYKDFDKIALLRALGVMMRNQAFVRGLLTPLMLGQQLRMTYRFHEYERIARASKFKDAVELRKMSVARLPVWVRIELRKREKR